MNYIFIDGSYFIFYKFYGQISAWKICNVPVPPKPIEDPEFVERFTKSCLRSLKEDIQKKLKLKKDKKYKIFIGKDCMRENIWRTQLYPEYKQGRKPCPEIYPFFDLAYSTIFPGNCDAVLGMEKLEADDCIALSVKHLQPLLKEDDQIFVFTSDKDYLQLGSHKLKIMNLLYKDITCYDDANLFLFTKIMKGDPSDNIKPVIKGLRAKLLTEYYNHRDFFEQNVNKETMDRYILNETLVDFNRIPNELKEAWIQHINQLVI
jgi:5'-3' exonuclease